MVDTIGLPRYSFEAGSPVAYEAYLKIIVGWMSLGRQGALARVAQPDRTNRPPHWA